MARANGTFLAVPVKAGSKEIVLSVESRGDQLGLKVSLAGLGGLALLALAGLFVRRREGEAGRD